MKVFITGIAGFFGIPLAKWFRSELRELLLEMLDHHRLEREGIFNPSYVGRLVKDHLAGRRDNRKELWTLTMFQLWKERWLETTMPSWRVTAGRRQAGGKA